MLGYSQGREGGTMLLPRFAHECANHRTSSRTSGNHPAAPQVHERTCVHRPTRADRHGRTFSADANQQNPSHA
jgi:hypothetical protein